MIVISLKQSLPNAYAWLKKTKIQETIQTAGNMDPMHEVCTVYPTQCTSRMGTARVKQEE